MDKNPDLTKKYLNRLSKRATLSAYRIARELRLTPTEAEETLWALLRNRQLNGKKFRRQHPIANYVVDFYCHESKLVVELDGDVHEEVEAKEQDQLKTAWLIETGITVLKFCEDEVIDNPQNVLQKIAEYL